jgi:lipoyl(octanoyl) transferase
MKSASAVVREDATTDPVLQVYLLGSVDFDSAQTLQRHLVYEVGGNRSSAALILCEHPPLITIGRHGSWAHVLCGPEERMARRWPVRWVNRGGGCLLHLPGQLAIYPILALDQLQLGLETYLDALRRVVASLLADFRIRSETRPWHAGLSVGDRPIAEIGVAVRSWVTYYGVTLNVNPDLETLRFVQSGGPECGRMTSIARERRSPLRPALVRERFLEHFTSQFQFARTSLFSNHSLLRRKAPRDAVATSS